MNDRGHDKQRAHQAAARVDRETGAQLPGQNRCYRDQRKCEQLGEQHGRDTQGSGYVQERSIEGRRRLLPIIRQKITGPRCRIIQSAGPAQELTGVIGDRPWMEQESLNRVNQQGNQRQAHQQRDAFRFCTADHGVAAALPRPCP